MSKSRTDSLVSGAVKAMKSTNHGSEKTRYNHLKEATRFVSELREQGYGVKQWDNLTNKHVAAVVDAWKDRGLSTATIKEYMSGVRAVADYFGNDRISDKNADFGIENRTYITNEDKSLPQDIYERVVDELKSSSDINDNRIAAQLMLERELGLRKEEAFKFHPDRAVLKNGTVFVQDGTKGGRERIIMEVSDRAKAAIEYAKDVSTSNGNTMSKEYSEKQWENKYYETIRDHGISKSEAGASSHGLRHAYAQTRYEQITGFKPPCRFDTKDYFRNEAGRIAGAEWTKLDSDARQVLKTELGHGPDRTDVISQYIGSSF